MDDITKRKGDPMDLAIAFVGATLCMTILIGGFVLAHRRWQRTDWLTHGGHGTVVNRSYDGASFSVTVQYASPYGTFTQTYNVRPQRFDALRAGDSVTLDQMN